MNAIEEIQISWEGPFSVDDIINNKIDKKKYEVKATDIGLYQVYGSHPLYGDGVLVYIGRTKNKNGGFQIRLKDRWVTQLGNDTENVKIYLGTIFSDYEVFADEVINNMIEKAEVLLISAMKPAYNSSNIQSVKDGLIQQRFIVHNEGNYRRLHPVLDSKYFWEASRNFAVVNRISRLLNIKINDEDDSYGFYLNKQFNISEEAYKIWFGVDYEIWKELKVPLMIQVYSENKNIKLNGFIHYSYKDGDTLDTYYIKLDKDFFKIDDNELEAILNNKINEIKNQINL